MKQSQNQYFGTKDELINWKMPEGTSFISVDEAIEYFMHSDGNWKALGVSTPIGTPDIYTAVAPIENIYENEVSMYGDQLNQTKSYFQYCSTSDTYYEYLGTTNGDASDYRELTADEVNVITLRSRLPIHKNYANESLMTSLASQRKQKAGFIYRKNDDNTYYEYLGTKNNSLASDYIQIGGGGGASWGPNVGNNTTSGLDNVLTIAASSPENAVNNVSSSRAMVVTGDTNTVSGTWYGTVAGYGNSVTNNYGGLVHGTQNTTTTYYCNASGRYAESRSYYTHAMGAGVVANNTGMFAVGTANVERANSNNINNPNNCVFVVGNGTLNTSGGDNYADVRSDAFEVLQSGLVSAPSLTTTLIENAGGDVLITKEYFAANSGSGSSDTLSLSSTITGNTNALVAHEGGMNEVTSASTITIQNNATIALTENVVLTYKQSGTATITLAAGPGVTLSENAQTFRNGDVISVWQKSIDVWEVLNAPQAIDSRLDGEPTGAYLLGNIVGISQADYDAGSPVSTTTYIIE